MVDRGKIGFGVLSWRGYDSLANSLESYERQRLLDLFDEKVLFLPEAGPRCIELARRYGLHEKTTPNNLWHSRRLQGFGLGDEFTYRSIGRERSSPGRRSPGRRGDKSTSLRAISSAAPRMSGDSAIDSSSATSQNRGHISPSGHGPRADASRSIHFAARLRRWIRPGRPRASPAGPFSTSDDADKRFPPRHIRLRPEGDYLVRSRCFPWCNNAFMVRRDFFLQTIIARIRGRGSKAGSSTASRTIETEINRRFWKRGISGPGSVGAFSHMIASKAAAIE